MSADTAALGRATPRVVLGHVLALREHARRAWKKGEPVRARMRALRNCEDNRTASLPVRDLSPGCTAGDAAACEGAADRCNGSLQAVAAADPIAAALEQARLTWISERDSRRLRSRLLDLLVELKD